MFWAVVIYLAFKWPEPTMALMIFLLTVVAAGFLSGNKLRWFLVPVWLTWLFWLGHHHMGALGTVRQGNAVEENGIVVCVGDSLTAYGYPDELQKLVSMKVQNFGFSGYDTDDGVKLVPEIVALRPSVVVLELGGHDYNTGGSRESSKENMRAMIEAFKSAGAEVLLVEIARGFINDPWYGFERTLAREYNLQLVPDTMMRRLVYWGPVFPPGSLVPESMRLSDDGLQPNERGNQMMAATSLTISTGIIHDDRRQVSL